MGSTMAVPFAAHHIRALISGNGASLITMENPVIHTHTHARTHAERERERERARERERE